MAEKLSLKRGEQAAGLTTLATATLAIGKGIAGYLSGSLVLITDAFHSASDITPGFASWFGLKVAQREPDEKFPYGYYKAESIATLTISLFIIYAGYEFIREGYSKLFVASEVSLPTIAGAAALVSVVVSFLMSRYLRKIGEETNSQSLIANANETRIDILASILVFIAIILSFYQVKYIEGVVTIGIALLVLKTGLETAKDSVFALMDVSPSKEIEKKVIGVIGRVAGVEGFKDLRLRKAGPFYFGEVILMVRKFLNVKRAHEITEKIEAEVKEEVERLDSITIHVEPYETAYEGLVVPVENEGGKDSKISDHFGRANYFAFVSIDKSENEIKEIKIDENQFKERKVRVGLNASKYVAKNKIDGLITKEIGEISFHTLRDELVDVYRAKGKNVKEIIDNYFEGAIKRLESPTREKE